MKLLPTCSGFKRKKWGPEQCILYTPSVHTVAMSIQHISTRHHKQLARMMHSGMGSLDLEARYGGRLILHCTCANVVWMFYCVPTWHGKSTHFKKINNEKSPWTIKKKNQENNSIYNSTTNTTTTKKSLRNKFNQRSKE